jgi:membrane protease YdiL (CAAX protease family)
LKSFAIIITILLSINGYTADIDKETNKILIPSYQNEYPDPILSGFLSLLMPGGGYYYNGDISKGAVSSALLVPLTLPYYITTDTFRGKSIKANTWRTASNIYLYTVFDSYQDASKINPDFKPVLKIKQLSAIETFTAPFNPENYSPSSALLIVPALNLIYNINRHGIHKSVTRKKMALVIPLIIAQSTMIGVGEESFGRGYMYSTFSQLTGSQFAGNVIQSIDFGLRHTDMMASRGYNSFPYGIGTLAFYTSRIDRDNEYIAEETDSQDASDKQYFTSTFFYGLILGFISGSSSDGILTAIALHTMWDALLITKDFLKYGNTGKMYLGFSIPFRF